MSERTAARLAWSIAVLSLAMAGGTLLLLYLNRAAPQFSNGGGSNIVPCLSFGVLGGLVASRQPRNAIGWLMLVLAVVTGGADFAQNVARRALLSGASASGWPRWPAWVGGWITGLALGSLILIFLLFPNGKSLGKRWKWVARATVVFMSGWAFGLALDPTPITLSRRLPALRNPVGLAAFAGFANSPAFFLILILLILGLVSLLLRLKRSKGEEHQQMKWFVYAAGISVSTLVLALPLSALSGSLGNALFSLAFTLGFAFAVPAAAAIAILRYGLYEIDVVINKTLVYFSLAAIITAIYVGVVVGIGTVIGARGNVGLSILATAIVAVAFQPIRARSRRFANRLVYGKRATPYEVLSEFADKMAGSYSLDDILPRTARMLAEGTGATRADVWLRVGRELHAAGSWPVVPSSGRIVLGRDDTPDVPGATRVAAVRHQGELLGALSVHKSPGDPITPTEDKLLADVAGQAGLVLRNVRLIEDLRASRQRLVSAQDEERRKIERNIHDGAQQQLVALSVKLRLLGQLADEDPEKTKSLAAELQAESTEALENLRDLARGIYPPLLADQGLVAALQSQARKSLVPVSVDADGIGRFSQGTEAAVYFCTLEALQNVTKYANASNASVGLAELGDSLTFTVRDDGVGFDPNAKGYGTGMQGMADRLAALGGELRVTSAPGEGTLIEGRVPIDRDAPAAAP